MDYEDIKHELREKGKSLAKIARDLGISRQTVCSVVKGKFPSWRITEAVAKELGKSVEEVFSDADERFERSTRRYKKKSFKAEYQTLPDRLERSGTSGIPEAVGDHP